MFRTLIATLAVAAVVAMAGTGSAYAQANDVKSVTGEACQAKKGGQQKDFNYTGGSIVNTTSVRRTVVCSVTRDNHSNTSFADSQLDQVRILINRSTKASKDFVCNTQVRDLRTGALYLGDTDTFALTGDATLSGSPGGYPLGAFSGDNAAEDYAISVLCKVPGKSRVRGIVWEEDINTDSDEGS